MKKPQGFFVRTLLFFRPFWGGLGLLFLVLFVSQLLGALSPYLLGKSVDAVIHFNPRNTIFFLACAFILAFIQAQIVSRIRHNIEMFKLDEHIEHSFSVRSLAKMFSFSVGQHVNEHSGVRQSVVMRGQNALKSFMFNIIYTILPTTIQIVITLILVGIAKWQISLVACIFVILYLWLSFKHNRAYFGPIEEIRKKKQHATKMQSELFRNSILVIAEGQEDRSVQDFEKLSQEAVNADVRTWFSYLKTANVHRFLITFGQFSSLAVGVYFIFTGKLSAGMFVALFAWMSSIFNGLVSLITIERQMLFQIVEIKKYFDLLDMAPDINPNLGGRTIEPLLGKIEFKNVRFAYPYRQSALEDEESSEKDDAREEDHAVSDVSLVIPAGAKVGFVGVSGSGKSTIVNLMRRYYDATGGEILVDDVPLKDLDLGWLRGKIGNVEQKIDLFDRSIRDNILFGLPKDAPISDEAVLSAVHDASLDEFVEKLKEGLDTKIGEGGIKVSGGERQRIGIARALIKNPKILIFDEATSALDSINEKLIHEAINRGAEGRTTIIIAHRLSTVMDADIIFVVADGRIAASGTHKELEKTSPEYQTLIKNQIF